MISVGSQPYLVEGMPSRYVLPENVIHVDNRQSEVAEALLACLPPDVNISGEGAEEVIYQHRRDGTLDIFFFVNQNLTSERRVQVRLPGTGRLETWDAFTGETKLAPGQVRDGDTFVRVDLPPAGSRLLVLDRNQTGIEKPVDDTPHTVDEVVELTGRWCFERKGPNVLPLDRCRVNLEGGGMVRT